MTGVVGGQSQCLTVTKVIASGGEKPPIVMLNLFQHLLFHCRNFEIPKQVRNDIVLSPPWDCVVTRLFAMTVVKGVQREIPLAGVWGYPPALLIPPLLEARGTGSEVNTKLEVC